MAVTVNQIINKARRITKSLNENRLSEAQALEYLNTVLLYEFPYFTRIYNLQKTFDFYTTPYVATYKTTDVTQENDLYDFKNKIRSIADPIYADGYSLTFYQTTEGFRNSYPNLSSIHQIGSGDGVDTSFNGTVDSAPILQKQVSITSIDANGGSISLHDIPDTDATTGQYLPTGKLYQGSSNVSYGTVNYETGAVNVTMPRAPQDGAEVNVHYVAIGTGRPFGVLFYADEFHFRPVPDDVYKITFNASLLPTAFIDENSVVELDVWWQYLSLLMSKKTFEDRMDIESIQKIMPLLDEQQRIVQRSLDDQLEIQRSYTPFAAQAQQNIPTASIFWPGGRT